MKALVVGFHERRNAGDDAMLLVLASELRQFYGALDIFLLTTPERLPSFELPGVQFFSVYRTKRNGLFRVFRCVERAIRSILCDILIFGGGSIFHSHYSIKWKLSMARTARLFDQTKKIMIIGVSLGPFDGPEAEALMLSLADLANIIVVRDEESFRFKSLGTAEMMKKFHQLPDLSHGLEEGAERPCPTVCANTKVLKGNVRQQPGAITLGVSLRPHPLGEIVDLRISSTALDAIKRMVNLGMIGKVMLVEFCGDAEIGDSRLLWPLFNSLSSEVDVEFVKYDGNPQTLLRVVGACNVFFGMRLHSQLFALLQAVPLLAIPYHQKTKSVLPSFGGRAYEIIPLQQVEVANIVSSFSRLLSEGDPISTGTKLIGCGIGLQRILRLVHDND